MRDGQENISSAEIVTIGTEMLLGDLVDTNTAWMSQRLAKLGVGVYRHTTVGDNSKRIVGALEEAASRTDLVVTTGGLGPTSDDLTNQCLATLTGREMVEYQEAREHVDRKFAQFGRTPTPSNYKQALFPEGTELIPNPLGTAMGALVEWEGTLFATLPGVPSEMKRMFEETLEPLLRSRSDGSIVSKTLHFAGLGESALAEKVQEFLDATDPTVAPLASQGKVRLRITTRAATQEEAQQKISPVEEEILVRLGDYFFGEDDETLEGAVARLLKERGATLALAESCTGGLLADPPVAPLASQGKVRLRIPPRAATEEEAQQKISPVEEEILARLGDYFFGEDDETLEGAVARLLKERGATLALAESCTGGLL